MQENEHTDISKNGHDAGGIDAEQAREGVRLLLEAVAADPERDGLEMTWQRRVPATFETLTEGSREAAKPRMETFPSGDASVVVKTGIPVYSLCEPASRCTAPVSTTPSRTTG